MANGRLVATASDVVAAMEWLNVGDEVELQVARGGQVVSLRGLVPAPPSPVASLGVRLKPGTLEVMRTDEGGLADAAGVLPDDLILAINGQLVASASDVRRAVDTLAEGSVALLQVNRGGGVTSLQATVTPAMMAVRQAAVSAVETSGPPKPGWYPSPTGDGSQAYWSGSEWQMPNATTAQGVPSASVGYPYPQTSGLAVAALICAFLVPFVLPIILGVAAKNDIRRSNGMKTGEGMATAGIVLGWIFTILIVLWIVAVFMALGKSRY